MWLFLFKQRSSSGLCEKIKFLRKKMKRSETFWYKIFFLFNRQLMNIRPVEQRLAIISNPCRFLTNNKNNNGKNNNKKEDNEAVHFCSRQYRVWKQTSALSKWKAIVPIGCPPKIWKLNICWLLLSTSVQMPKIAFQPKIWKVHIRQGWLQK